MSAELIVARGAIHHEHPAPACRNRWNRGTLTKCDVKREALAPDVEEVARTPPPPRAPPVPPPPPPPLITIEELASHWCNQAALFNKANGYVKGALTKISLPKYVQEFGHLSELSPYGTKCLMAMARRFHQQYLYRYQFTDPVRCGVFTTPYEFSKKASQEPLDVKDASLYAAHFPTIYQQIGSGDYAYVVCLNILLEDSRPWKVHMSRIVDGGLC